MSQLGTKRERLLDWIRNGDPQDVPVLFFSALDAAASYLRKHPSDLTWPQAMPVIEKIGVHGIYFVASPYPFDAIPFLDDISMDEKWDELPNGTRRLTQQIKTPEGLLKSVQEFPKDQGCYHREFFVKGDEDLPAFACYIRRATEEVVSNPLVARRVEQNMTKAIDEMNGLLPTFIHVFCPAMELMSSWYMDQEIAIFSICDHRSLMEELMDSHWRMTQVWLELAARNNVDIYNYTLNGLEWLSPDLYERYMIPQARCINEFATAQGKLSWVHTCGKKKKLAGDGAYQKMKVDVVESLSSPPTGDIDDLAQTRRDVGSEIATRGGINVELLYDDDLARLRKQTEYVLDSTAGFRHMPGDTNSSSPPYPWKNIETVIDVVRQRGRLFE